MCSTTVVGVWFLDTGLVLDTVALNDVKVEKGDETDTIQQA